jgi:putative addiction module CopG family antidote
MLHELWRFFPGRRSLTDELANFAKAKVAAGGYTSSGEVVRKALRLMEKLEGQEAERLSFLPKAGKTRSTAARPGRSISPPSRSKRVRFLGLLLPAHATAPAGSERIMLHPRLSVSSAMSSRSLRFLAP